VKGEFVSDRIGKRQESAEHQIALMLCKRESLRFIDRREFFEIERTRVPAKILRRFVRQLYNSIECQFTFMCGKHLCNGIVDRFKS